jgi:hypothetical protein
MIGFSRELRDALDAIPQALTDAAATLDFTGGTSVAEVADTTLDMLCEEACLLSPQEVDELQAAVVRRVIMVFRQSAGSDATFITEAQLAQAAAGQPVTP